MKRISFYKLILMCLFTATILVGCKKDKDDNEVRIDSYEFKWTGINDANFNGGTNNASSISLKLFMHDPTGQLNAGSTWVETVGGGSPHSYAIGKPTNNTFFVTGLLAYGGASSTNTIMPYRVYIKLKDGTNTNEIKFEAIRQPGAN